MARKIQKSKIDLFIISQITKMRNQEGFSQEDLAIHLNVSTGFIGQVESPKYRAKYNLIHLNELAKLFKCSPRDFLPEKPL